MSPYSIALFLHIVGAILFFALLTIEGVSLRQGVPAAQLGRILGPISALLILIPGLYMVASPWGWKGWIVLGIAGWFLIAAGGAATGILFMANRVGRRAAAISWLIRIGMALGVVFVMTVKPDAAVAAIAVVAGALLGGAAGLAVARRQAMA